MLKILRDTSDKVIQNINTVGKKYKKTLKLRFVCGVKELRSFFISIRTAKRYVAPDGVIYTFTVYRHSVGSALFVPDRKAMRMTLYA